MNHFVRSIVAAVICSTVAISSASDLWLLQADGKLVTVTKDVTPGHFHLQLERRGTDGNLDTQFGRGGRVTFSLGVDSPSPRSLRVDTLGRLLVIGSTFGTRDRSAPAIMRFLPDGRPDASWGAQGRSLASASDGNALGFDALDIGDNSVLLLGHIESAATQQVALWRLRGNGSVDTDFGIGGVLPARGLGQAHAVSLQRDDDGATLIAVQVRAQDTTWLEVHRWQAGMSEPQRIARQPAPAEWGGAGVLDRSNGSWRWSNAGANAGAIASAGIPLVRTAAIATWTQGARDFVATDSASGGAVPLGNAAFNPFTVQAVPSHQGADASEDRLQWQGWMLGMLAALLAVVWWLRRRPVTIDLGTRDRHTAQAGQAVRGVKVAAPTRADIQPSRGGVAADDFNAKRPVFPAPIPAPQQPATAPPPAHTSELGPRGEGVRNSAAAPEVESAPLFAQPPENARSVAGAAPGRGGCRNRLARPEFGDPDNLKRIKGVGPMLERRLRGEGVYYFWQIAEWERDDVAIVDSQLNSFKGRIQRDAWVAQAIELARQPGSSRRPQLG